MVECEAAAPGVAVRVGGEQFKVQHRAVIVPESVNNL